MKVRIRLEDEMLGTMSANPKVHEEFIASKSADAEKAREELAALPATELIEKALTVFPRTPEGKPFVWDYQMKGFLKHACGVLIEIADKEIRVGKTKISKFTFKRIVDNYVFVTPRQCILSSDVSGICTRPLRADTMQGERVSLCSSEVVPAGTTFDCEIKTLSPVLDGLLPDWLNYGSLNGLLQWRNAGKGRFTWAEIK